MNAVDVLLLVLIAAAVALALRRIYLDRKTGKGCLGCGGDCAACGRDCGRRRDRS